MIDSAWFPYIPGLHASYSPAQLAAMAAAAIAVDWIIGDPRWPTHPVVWIGRLISRLERQLRPIQADTSEQGSEKKRADARGTPVQLKSRGLLLAFLTVMTAWLSTALLVTICTMLHPWLGITANVWLISTTLAVKGLKDAAYQVYRPLEAGDLEEARKYTGYIVGRDTGHLEESELTRAAVETVAENTVDAFVSPILYALLGGAPLAMLYRASNTLDSMLGYRNEKYMYFGWASARWDDVVNFIPARIAGVLLTVSAALSRGLSPVRAAQAIRRFAHLHPSPNSGIPESAVAGAMGIELGGVNRYGGVSSERARMGWPLRPLVREDIRTAVSLLYKVSYLIAGGCICAVGYSLWQA